MDASVPRTEAIEDNAFDRPVAARKLDLCRLAGHEQDPAGPDGLPISKAASFQQRGQRLANGSAQSFNPELEPGASIEIRKAHTAGFGDDQPYRTRGNPPATLIERARNQRFDGKRPQTSIGQRRGDAREEWRVDRGRKQRTLRRRWSDGDAP